MYSTDYVLFLDSSRNVYNDIRSASTAAEFSELKGQTSKAVYENKGFTQPQPTAASAYKVFYLCDMTCVTRKLHL